MGEKCIHVGPWAPCFPSFCMVRCWAINNLEMNIYSTPGRTYSLHRFDVITWRKLEISPRQVPPTPIPHHHLIQFCVPARSKAIWFNIHPRATMRHGNYSAKPLPMFACVIPVTTPTKTNRLCYVYVGVPHTSSHKKSRQLLLFSADPNVSSPTEQETGYICYIMYVSHPRTAARTSNGGGGSCETNRQTNIPLFSAGFGKVR